ncbi:MAG: phosphatase PAP2 family protein [Elusimicrobiota bacterium]
MVTGSDVNTVRMPKRTFPKKPLTRKKIIIIVSFILSSNFIYANSGGAFFQKYKFDKEWKTIIGLNLAATSLHFVNFGIIKMSSEEKSYKSETVHSEYLLVPMVSIPFSIMWANKDDKYNHFKGYWMCLNSTYFMTELTKSIVERKRPNYDNAKIRGEKTDKKSFFSGHSAQSFAMFTYLGLYTYKHTQNIFLKYAVPILSESTASWIAWTRVNDHWHHENDIIVGSLIGITDALITYNFYDKKDKNDFSLKLEQDYLGVRLRYSFR